MSLACLNGCQQHYLAESDYHQCKTLALQGLAAPEQPESGQPLFPLESPTITTALDPAADRRPISLAECIALALENGRTGRDFGRRVSTSGAGLPNGTLSARTDSIRVLAADPAVFGAEVEESLARFDTVWQSGMSWSKIDEPSNPIVFSGASLTPAVLDSDQAQFRTGLVKPLPTGGLAGISFQTNYELSNFPLGVQPAYRPVLSFTLEQPLLQGAGVAINQLRDLHPGGLLTPFLPSARVPGILLARITFNQSKAEFERQVQDLVFAVEEAYWQLYAAYWDLYAREIALLQTLSLWQIVQDRFEAGRVDAGTKAQTESQVQNFRAVRLRALARVLETERLLRYVVGLPPEDGFRLVPSDTPNVAKSQPDWPSAVQEALARRPELFQAREAFRAAQLIVERDKDFLLPDVRAVASYNVNALGSHLDGKDDNGALRNLAENRFNDWTVGIRAEIPIGYRAGNAEVRKAQLRLAQAASFLRDQEAKVKFDLQRSYRDLIQINREIEFRRAQREQAAIQVRGRFETFVAGRPNVTLDVLASLLLEAQRNFADSLTEEHRAIFEYNVSLADFERQKGTILEEDNVQIVEGMVPSCAQARASEHLRERQRSVKLLGSPGCGGGWPSPLMPSPEPAGNPMLPELPTGDPLPMPRLLEQHKGMADLLEKPDAADPAALPDPSPPGGSSK